MSRAPIPDTLPGLSRPARPGMLRVVALDLAPAATGIAATHNRDGDPGLVVYTAKSANTGQARIWDVNVAVAEACPTDAHLAVIENYSYGSYRGKAGEGPGLDTLCQLAELHGVIRQWLWYFHIPLVTVAPQTRAVYATGHGRADKSAVLAATQRTYHEHIYLRDTHQGDAFLFLAMALDRYGAPLVELPETHRRALRSVRWPDLVPGNPVPAGAETASAGRRGQIASMP